MTPIRDNAALPGRGAPRTRDADWGLLRTRATASFVTIAPGRPGSRPVPVVPMRSPLPHPKGRPMPPSLTAVRSCRAVTGATDLDDAVAEFADLRPRLLGIAYRILGRWAETEDIVQDAWVRWQNCDRTVVVSPTAFLVTTTTHLALNAAQSARAARVVPRRPAARTDRHPRRPGDRSGAHRSAGDRDPRGCSSGSHRPSEPPTSCATRSSTRTPTSPGSSRRPRSTPVSSSPREQAPRDGASPVHAARRAEAPRAHVRRRLATRCRGRARTTARERPAPARHGVTIAP